ncbi:MAG: tripartite tricarboxylate transporter substrate binding protein [Rubrivivax sp.]
MDPTRRRHLKLAALAPCAAWGAFAAPAARAQGAWPERPVTFIVPQAPGGANDTIARIVTQKLATVLKQSLVVENRTGAGGNIGTAAVAKARNDGYTMLLTTNSAQVINPWLYKNTGFDPIKDFEPVATVATAGYVLVCNPSFPARNVAEMVAHVKSQPPRSITIASAGNGTLNHLIGAMLEKTAGIDLVHVPYRGAAAAAGDVVGGQVPLSVQSLPSSIGFIKAGRLRALGVVNEKRIAALPDVPTIGETYAGFGSTPWYGVLAPAGTPRAAIERLQAALFETLDSKEVQDQLAAQGCEVLKRGAADFAAMIRAELPLWAKVVKDSGATVD